MFLRSFFFIFALLKKEQCSVYTLSRAYTNILNMTDHKIKEAYDGLYCEPFQLPQGLSLLISMSIDIEEFEPLEDGGEI